MSRPRHLLLCCDLDRTLLPNGEQPESPQARQRFKEFVAMPEVILAYVSGRDRWLTLEAIGEYGLPTPDYAITDVGSRIYQILQDEWVELEAWAGEIDADWHGHSHADLQQLFSLLPDLQLQEAHKQNTHKLSYYVALEVNHEALCETMQQMLAEHGVQASLIWSIDEPRGIGLLDVLPRNATKLHAVDFLRRRQAYATDEVVFAGDSGNDLLLMASEIPSVLVANASAEVKQQARTLAQQRGNVQRLYLAQGCSPQWNGNYADGVLEGVWHFAPAFRDQLQGMR